MITAKRRPTSATTQRQRARPSPDWRRGGTGLGRGDAPVPARRRRLRRHPGGDRLPGRGRPGLAGAAAVLARAASTWPCTSTRSRRRSPRRGCATSGPASSRPAARTRRRANCPTRTWRPPPTTPPTSPNASPGARRSCSASACTCTVHARTEAELLDACAQVKAAAASTLIEVQPATWRHLAGWTTTLPLATDSLQMLPHHGHPGPGRRVPARQPPTCPRRCPATRPAPAGVLYGVNPDSGGHRLVGPVGAGELQLRRPGPLRRRQVLLREARGAAQPVPGRAGRGHRPRRRIPAPGRRGRRHRRAARRRRREAQPPRPAGRRRPPRRAHPPRPVPAHPHRGAARACRRRRPNAPPWTGRSWPCTGRPGSPPTRATHHRPAPLLRDLADVLRTADDDAGRPAARRPARPVGGTALHRPVRRAHHHPPGRAPGGVVAAAPARRAAHRRHPPRLGRHLAAGRPARPVPHRPRRRRAAAGGGGRGVAADARRRGRPVPVPHVQGRPQTQRRPDGGHPGRRRRARHRPRPGRRVQRGHAGAAQAGPAGHRRGR